MDIFFLILKLHKTNCDIELFFDIIYLYYT